MNNAEIVPSCESRISLRDRLSDKYRSLRVRLVRKLLYDLAKDSNCLAHTRAELESWNEEPDSWMREALCDLIAVHSLQGHSGFSNEYAVALFSKLARFEPVGPLTGHDSEWMHISDELYQNKRCSHVFKEDGVAYDSEGKIFQDETGSCWTNIDSRVVITFPYIPVRVYVDVNSE